MLATYTLPILLSIQPVFANTLQEAVSNTIATNPSVLAAANEREAVRQEISQARAGYLPSVDLAVGTGWERTNNPSTNGSVSRNRDEASIQLRQMLFDGLATPNEVKRHTARTDSRSYGVFSVAENTALDAVLAYHNVLRQQTLVELAQTNLEAHQRTHDQITLRSERGVGRGADMEQSLSRLALAQANLVAEQSNLRDAETAYLRVVGVAPTSLTLPESPVAMIPGSVDEAVNQAINNHPTLKAASSDVESAHAQHATARAPFMPRVDFEVRSRHDHNIDGARGRDKDMQAMLRLRYNLLSGGRDTARRQETAYLINQAAEIRNNTHRQVEESVRLSWNAMENANSQLSYLRQHVEAAEKSRDAYQQQFNLGQRTLLDLLDSENEVFRARIAHTNAQYDQLYSHYRIMNSMGMLLESLNVPAPDTAVAISAQNQN
ncbi:type I secretion outer membrane protein [Methylophaga lonarensis MPL]|uniref:Type I secretion outer membrane protein n=1 Tax=Methylophaga lonarensis MPL TaxID=1286106 RepID=M7P3P7_9GAMM|nr:TolC family outer membrane protein [Methylophaga lonarensis]EMR14142.1 type I secretion outer membrane protein [Methylophaga lonarensis MPL]